MKTDWTHLDRYREPHPVTGYLQAGDTAGAFRIPHPNANLYRRTLTHFIVMAVDGRETGWEHVSVHVRYRDGRDKRMRTPFWEEMCWIRDLFWEPDEAVVQFHPAQKDYVNVHHHVLHLWRCTHREIPMPPTILV